MISQEDIDRAVTIALREDLGPELKNGDITSTCLVGDQTGSARINAEEDGIIAGLIVVEAVFDRLNSETSWRARVAEGDEIKAGQTVAEVSGDKLTILAGERVALNFLARLSGIATMTNKFVTAVSGTGAKIFDTRKTTPGLRALEKYAVKAGGGFNQRMGLFDAILIKDNHLVGRDIAEAIKSARAASTGQIEVEVESIGQFRKAVAAGADVVLLDNMGVEEIIEAVEIVEGKVEIEVSGGISLSNVAAIAAAGPQRISIGALTQRAPSLDFSLTVEESG